MMSTQNRKRIVFALALLSVVTTMGAMWLFMPRERLLTDLAHPILAVDTTPVMSNPKETVYWLASNLLLIITTEHDSYGADAWNGINDWTGHAELYDTGRHTRTRLVGLTHLLNRPGRFHGSHPSDFQLSPTGTRLYWSAFLAHRLGAGYTLEYGTALSTLEGNELREWPLRRQADENDQSSFWMDDQHLVEVMREWNGQPWHLRIHDARDAHGDRTIASSSPETSAILAQYGENHPLLTSIDRWNEQSPKITRRWFDVNSRQIRSHTNLLPLPQNARLDGEIDHYRHQSMAPFILVRSETPLLLAWLHRFIPSVSVKPIDTEGLWVSRADVQHMQEIGHVPLVASDPLNVQGDVLEQVQWLPDGRRISFVYRGMLYVVPVDHD